MTQVNPDRQRLTQALPSGAPPPGASLLVGILPGEGIGPEVVPAALKVLDAVAQAGDISFELRHGGRIGLSERAVSGTCLSPEVIEFCASVFAEGGSLFCGPGGGDFVYRLREQFDLYCKFTPIHAIPALHGINRFKQSHLSDIDMVLVRENSSGLYLGQSEVHDQGDNGKLATHHFSYHSSQIERILDVSLRLARTRRKRLTVVTKPGGIPGISSLWLDVLDSLDADGVEVRRLEIDYAIYQILAAPEEFDVIVAPNMFGDVLADAAALLMGARGMSYSGNFGPQHRAVYQTGHGAAKDLAGMDRANPLGQIHSLAMMLRESFGLFSEAEWVLHAIEQVLRAGWHTADIAEPGSQVVSTSRMGELVAEAVRIQAEPAPDNRLYG